jgi:hypothetical protein
VKPRCITLNEMSAAAEGRVRGVFTTMVLFVALSASSTVMTSPSDGGSGAHWSGNQPRSRARPQRRATPPVGSDHVSKWTPRISWREVFRPRGESVVHGRDEHRVVLV